VTRYESYLLQVTKDISTDVKEIHKELQTIQVEIAQLKVKAGIWGLAAGAIPAGITILLQLI